MKKSKHERRKGRKKGAKGKRNGEGKRKEKKREGEKDQREWREMEKRNNVYAYLDHLHQLCESDSP